MRERLQYGAVSCRIMTRRVRLSATSTKPQARKRGAYLPSHLINIAYRFTMKVPLINATHTRKPSLHLYRLLVAVLDQRGFRRDRERLLLALHPVYVSEID